MYELKDNPDRTILKDTIVVEAISEIEKINKEIESTKKKGI